VRLLALDADGVLTDASINIDDQGHETKRFNVRDGQGIVAWMKVGMEVAVVTRRSGPALQHRCRELGITRLVQGCQDKAEALRVLAAQTGVPVEAMAFVGDDWADLPALRVAGFPVVVADAASAAAELAAMVTRRRGGHGAVREVIEHLLASQGLTERVLALFDPARADRTIPTHG
jgi:3-deoxy-D-manno-octulosonate 8-phosphate phosphatase (KDO 8-P phosphatase)